MIQWLRMDRWIDWLNLLSGDWATAMLRASWQGGAALVVAWAICRFPRVPARIKCWIWRLAYLKLVLGLALATPLKLPLLPAPKPEQIAIPARMIAPVANQDRTSHALQPAGDSSETMAATVAPSVDPARSDPARPSLRTAPVATHATPIPRPTATTILLLIWLVGLLVAARNIRNAWRRTRILRQAATPSDDPSARAELEELAARIGLGRLPALLVSDCINSPLLLGIRRPAVVMPSAMNGQWSRVELRLIIAHELAHLRRRDLAWNWMEIIVRALFFFHPLLWLARRQWRLAQEIACDELALATTRADAADYGAALLRIVARQQAMARPLMTVAMGESRRSLEWRLRAMRNLPATSKRTLWLAGLSIAVLVLLGLIPWTVVAQQSPPGSANQPAGAVKSQPITANGIIMVPSRLITAPKDGTLIGPGIKDGQHVKKRDLLYQYDQPSNEAELHARQQQADALAKEIDDLKKQNQPNQPPSQDYVDATDESVRLDQKIYKLKFDTEAARIVAPFDGVLELLDRDDLEHGNAVSAGQPLARLTGTSNIQIDFYLPPTYAPSMRLGQELGVTLTLSPTSNVVHYTAQVISLARIGDPGNEMIEVTGELNNPDNHLLRGSKVNIQIETK